MRLHRFFTSETVGNRSELTIRSADLVNQLRRVFRLKVGEEVVLFDGSGSEHECAIASWTGNDGVVFDVHAISRSRYMPSRKLYLCAAVVKKDNFETIVEKATELGVTDIVPVLAEHSEKKSLNMARLKKIAIEASEQSGRGNVPSVHEIQPLEACIGSMKEKENIELKAFHTEGEAFNRKDLSKDSPLAILIGPEGGWSPDEIAMFHKNDVAIRCLGPQVLRAETAVISALSQVVFDN